jgi:protein phosphatase
MLNMQVKGWVKTDPGLKRDNNQDAFLYDKNLGIFIVADGMGGHKGGEVASALACAAAKETLCSQHNQHLNPREILRFAYAEASSRIFEHAKAFPDLTGMGTTMVMGYLKKNILHIANVGDSRCYLARGPMLWQLTEDHSLMNEQVRSGIMTIEQAKKMVAKNVITRSVGFEHDVVCDVIERIVSPGEIYLFCSDGLHGLVSDRRIGEIIYRTPIDSVTHLLIEEAKKNGGDDNITTLIFRAEE